MRTMALFFFLNNGAFNILYTAGSLTQKVHVPSNSWNQTTELFNAASESCLTLGGSSRSSWKDPSLPRMASRTLLLTEQAEWLMPGGQISIWPSNLETKQVNFIYYFRTNHSRCSVTANGGGWVTRSCLTLATSWTTGSSICGIFQARVLEWVIISSSRGSSWSRDRISVPHIGRLVLYQLSHEGNPYHNIGIFKTAVEYMYYTKISDRTERGCNKTLIGIS